MKPVPEVLDKMADGDGPLVRACPVCNQIDPKDPGKRDFMEEAHGHKRSCKLKQLIDAFGGGRRK